MMTMQPSLTTMKTVTAYDQSLHLRDIERRRARVARERTHESKVLERKWELFVSLVPRGFTAHSRVRLPLEMKRSLPVHYIFSGSRSRSLLGEPVYVRNSEQKFELFKYEATSTMAPSLLLHPFQPSLNKLTTLRHSHVPDTKTPHIRVIQRRLSVYFESILY